MTEKKNYALPIAMMYLLFFMIAFVTNLCNPMAGASLPAYCLKR